MTIEPETKDWAWVITSSCPECGFDPHTVERADISNRILASVDGWSTVLSQPNVTARPDSQTWSPLEYACHVRDMIAVMTERLDAMLHSQPVCFNDWNQDATAVDSDYGSQVPRTVGDQLGAAAAGFAELYRLVGDDNWERQGLRSDNLVFTVETLAVYAIHDLEHHRVDVGLPARR
ncbi:methyltransferase type 12 [Gordonia sp. (in: high G+C Gram-positive bacteria)]|uniref:methyltransferase type 12 n=1 Tax=Gordonia sp. (in: high G+C Gram-positive bacteria) TaxID=84139 RepID=UPI003C724E21